ncbi:ead/Ea22-like family protein [Salmonella enterica]
MKQIAQENIIELAKLGHERAAELKASCGAVDMRSVARLISDLATQLEVQYVRAEESQREFRSADITMQNLEAKCAALAEENAGLNVLIEEECFVYSSDTPEPIDANDCKPETKVTDAFLAEVRAQARNEGINYAASRLAAAFNHGFVDKPLSEVYDVVRMILSAKEDLANDSLPATDGLSGEYAEKAIEEWEAQLRKGTVL